MGNSMSRGAYGSRYNRGGYGAQPVAAAPAARRPFFYIGWRGNRGGMRTAPRRGYATGGGGVPVRRRRNRFGMHFGRNRGYY
jgi:hypothetical protein